MCVKVTQKYFKKQTNIFNKIVGSPNYGITFISPNENNAMKNLNTILSVIEKLEAKRDNFTITFEEASQLAKLIELAETLVNEL